MEVFKNVLERVLLAGQVAVKEWEALGYAL